MNHNQELTKLRNLVENQLSKECEQAFFAWKNGIILAANSTKSPYGLNDQLEIFLNEKRPSFYKNYQAKLRDKLSQKINELLSESLNTVPKAPMLQSLTGQDFKTRRDRAFLEAYFVNNQVGRKAAEYLGIAKSTFHDWLKANQALIEDELRSRQYAMNNKDAPQVITETSGDT